MNALRQRRPTIRRVRDWNPEAPAGQLRLAPPPRDLMETLPADVTRPYTDSEAIRLVPKHSEVRGILVPRVNDDDEEADEHETLVWAPAEEPESENIKLDSLVSTFSKRAAALEEERKIALEAAERAAMKRARDRERRKLTTVRRNRRHQIVQLASEHRYKIVYSIICVWGLLQLMLSR